jgi:hypothetical protein
MFIAPTARDLAMAKVILDTFEGASGLGSNLAKCQLVSICRAEDQVQTALSIFPCQRLEFPITYLGMPLSVYKLSLTSLQPYQIIRQDGKQVTNLERKTSTPEWPANSNQNHFGCNPSVHRYQHQAPTLAAQIHG